MTANQTCRTAVPPVAPILKLCGLTIVVAMAFTGLAAAEQPGAASADVRAQGEAGRMSTATVRMVQHSLIQGGYAVDAADGIWGPKTAAALREFQRAKGLEPSGQPDSKTLAALGVPLDGASGGAAQRDGAATPPISSRSPSDLNAATIRSIQQALDDRGLQTGPVDGVWGERTTEAIANLQRAHGMPASGELDAYTLSLLGLLPNNGKPVEPWRSSRAPGPADLDPAAIRLIQRSLSERGHSTGVDGIWGNRTENALREFQRSQGLEPRGRPDVHTLAALGLLPGSR